MGKYKTKRSREISSKEMNNYITIANEFGNESRNKAILAILYITGCRVSEVIDMKRRDFNEDENGYITISILNQKQRNKSPTEDRRILTISPTTPFINYIKDFVWKFADDETKLFDKSRQCINKILKKIDPTLCPHLFRHNRAQKLANAGLTHAQLQAFFGWSDAQSADSYVKKSSTLAAAARDVIE